MSVEALWWFETPDMQGEDRPTGVVVLETGRVFGGDSALAMTGHYEVNGNRVTGEARSFQYRPDVIARNVFGMETPIDYRFGFDLTLSDDNQRMAGEIWLVEDPEVRLPTNLTRMADLP